MLIAPFVAAAALAVLAPSPTGSVIAVSDVEQLYDAVNEPANAGAAIVMAPGQIGLFFGSPCAPTSLPLPTFAPSSRWFWPAPGSCETLACRDS